LLGQNKITVFGTLAYQQAIAVGNWPFASAFAIFFIFMLGVLALVGSWLTTAIQKFTIKESQI
ncbi:MAG: hypothetical protein GYA59_12125, partial [Chloroflexi bacterium]|nr:hypothetical protein [Chloroflexota bacterium]